jgi:tRNA nucleotidyltransferase/poly(A) polymerase
MSPHRDAARVFQVLLHHPAVEALARAAAAAGVEAHLVGGVLRDRFLGLPSRDLDGVVGDRGEAVGRRMAEELGARLVDLGGKDFGAYRLIGRPAGGESGPGRDPGASPGAGGDWVLDLWDREGVSLARDLARRDLTINSFALVLPGGELVDPHGGLADLRHRVLRATTPESFTGDPLRVLRLPRLLAQLPGFSAEPVTLALARASAAELAGVASERVRDELALFFSQADAPRGVAVLGVLGLYPGLWLGTADRLGSGTGVEGAETGRAAGIGRLCGQLGHLGPAALRLRELAGGALPFPVRHRLARLALTFAALPDPPGRRPEPGETARRSLERFAEAGYLTRRDAADLAALLAWERLPGDELGRRRFLHALGPLWTTAVCYAGARGREDGPGWERAAAALLDLYRREGETILNPPTLLDGREVGQILNVPPGPDIGRALRDLRLAQVEGRVKTRQEAQRLIENLR